MSQNVIDTINTIFGSFFKSIDTNLYKVLDDLTFINSSIIEDKNLKKILGTSASNGLLLVANALLIGFIIYFSIKYFTSNYTFSKIENPVQFIIKLIIYGIVMNSSYFIISEILDINSNICEAIKSIGEDIFKTNIGFANLITSINENLGMSEDVNVFSIEGIIKGTTMISLINLVTTYGLRYIVVKIFVLISPFAILSLCLESTSWFFKLWVRNLFSLLCIQIVVSLVLILLFSLDYDSKDLITKFIYMGGIYALIRANTFVREFMTGAGITTSVR